MAVVTILGAGVMGSSMSMPLADRGHEVRLVGTHLDESIIDSVEKSGRHPKLNATLPKGIKPFHHTGFKEALGIDTDVILLGVSSAGIEWAIEKLCGALSGPAALLMITKGMQPEPESLSTLPDHVQREIKRRRGIDVAVAAIGGPCIAGELAARRNTGTVITSRDSGYADKLCAMLGTDYYHPRASSDLVGVEACAAFKNFYAIAVGWAAGRLETMDPAENGAFNHNAAAIIFDQAIRELMALTLALGGTAESVWGMPGAGDLYVTSMAGRNSRLGNNLGRGLTFSQTKSGPMKGDTIEGAELGVAAAASLRAMMAAGTLAKDAMPLTSALLDALTGNAPIDIPWRSFHR
jgi:glycerol-3-phosphate dehydrogenase (NAD(P)+)